MHDLTCYRMAIRGLCSKVVKSVFAFLSGTHFETFAFRERLNQLCKLLKHVFANKRWGGERNFPCRFLGTDSHAFLMATTLYIKPRQHNSHFTLPLDWAHPLQDIARGSHGGTATAKLTWTVRRPLGWKGKSSVALCSSQNCLRALKGTVNIQGKRSVKTI